MSKRKKVSVIKTELQEPNNNDDNNNNNDEYNSNDNGLTANKRRSTRKSININDDTKPVKLVSKSESCKLLNACFECVIPYLGRYIPVQSGQVKGSVMYLLSGKIGGSDHVKHNKGLIVTPTFNRMSGIQEWLNCICLFVNIFGDSYINMWEEIDSVDDMGNSSKYLQIKWFAQPTQHEQTQVIKRILSHKNKSVNILKHNTNIDTKWNNNNNTAAELKQIKTETKPSTKYDDCEIGREDKNTPTILLFCRLLNEPYVYCGDLKYISHIPSIYPLQLTFQLNQSQHPSMIQSEPFQLLINAAIHTNRTINTT